MDHLVKARHQLVNCLGNTENILIETNLAAVMKDRYPKAQYHFLVVCKEDISKVTLLKREHIPLLDHMMELGNQIIEQQNHLTPSHFRVGFKMNGFMDRLTMHVISNDFYSVSLKKKNHWNSFNSDLFLTYQAAYALLQLQGYIEPLTEERALQLRYAEEMQCNQCKFKTKILLELKAHLFEHWNAREHDIEVKKQVENITQMLDGSKLNEAESKVESPKTHEPSKQQSTQWRQSTKQERTNAAKEPPTDWRKRPNLMPNNGEQQQSGSTYNNHFDKCFQKSVNRRQQQHMHPMPEHALMGPPPFSNAQQAYAFNGLHQFVAQHGQPFMGRQQPIHANMNANQINYKHFLGPQTTESPSRFNPFKQAPNMANLNPHQRPVNPSNRANEMMQNKAKWTSKQQNKPNTTENNSHGNSSTGLPDKPMKSNQNKPKWTPKPQQKQPFHTKHDDDKNSKALQVQPNKTNPKSKPKPTPTKQDQSANLSKIQSEKK